MSTDFSTVHKSLEIRLRIYIYNGAVFYIHESMVHFDGTLVGKQMHQSHVAYGYDHFSTFAVAVFGRNWCATNTKYQGFEEGPFISVKR